MTIYYLFLYYGDVSLTLKTDRKQFDNALMVLQKNGYTLKMRSAEQYGSGALEFLAEKESNSFSVGYMVKKRGKGYGTHIYIVSNG